MQCFILAGGFATRLWPLTEKRAKPLLPLAGKPLITYLIEKIPKDLPITVSTNAVFKDAFEKWKKGMKRSVDILIEDTVQDDHKLGALGAVAQWIREKNIDDDVLLLTGDNYCGFSFEDFLHTFHGITLIAVYDIHKTDRAKLYGTVITNQNTVTGFEEKPIQPKTTLINTGASVLPSHILPILTEWAISHPDNIGGIFEELLRRKQHIECFRFSEPWFDIGSFDTYLEATTTLVGDNIISSGSISPDSKIEGSVVIGSHSQVIKSNLHNVVLFENCHITDCVLENCIIDDNSTLSHVDLTHKMIREGTILVPKGSPWET
ncbi:NDP-sugar synthase [Candidatus Peregrinibacteria bacterium]|nr:NDP-sugar synthase [Candidatus Peregrinibacteria bacterium]